MGCGASTVAPTADGEPPKTSASHSSLKGGRGGAFEEAPPPVPAEFATQMKAVIDEARFSLDEDIDIDNARSPTTSICGTSDTSMDRREMCDRLLRTEFGVGEEFLDNASSLNPNAFVGDAIKARLLQHWVRGQLPAGRTRSSSVDFRLEAPSWRTAVLARSGHGSGDEAASPSFSSSLSFSAGKPFHTAAGECRVGPEPTLSDSRSGCVRAARTQRYHSDPPAPLAWMIDSRRSRARGERESDLLDGTLAEGTRSRRRSSGNLSVNSTRSKEAAVASEGR